MTHAQPIQLAYGTEPLFPCPARVPLSPSLLFHLLRSSLYFFPLFSSLLLSSFFFISPSPSLLQIPPFDRTWNSSGHENTGERKTMHRTSLPLLLRKGFTATPERVTALHTVIGCAYAWMDVIGDDWRATKFFLDFLENFRGIYENTRKRKRARG